MSNATVLALRQFGLMLAIFLAVGLLTQPVGAQILYGTLVGNVTDESGAVVSGATVTLTNKGTGQTREAVTNDEGDYSAPNLLPGIYDIKVTKQGFSTFSQVEKNIESNTVTRVDVQMKVGNVTDVVSVAADSTVLQSESATVKSEISGREINALPISGYRNYQTLINLVPGATPAAFQNANTDTPERALTTNVNGTARNNNNTRLDGAQSVNIWLPHHSAYVPPSDSIQEVNISTNNFDAEQGLAGGAAVQVITKSGSNNFHGSLFTYHDNHVFRARNVGQTKAVSPQKPKALRNIPGATLGGPIVKDKLFFFGSWEGMFERVIKDNFFTVPTADIRAGDFSAYNVTIYDPFTGNINGTGRTPFTGARIPDNRINSAARKILALIPQPNVTNASGAFPTTRNFYNSAPQVFDRNNYDAKINWNRTSNHQIWGKFSHMHAEVTGSFGLAAAGGPCLCDGGSGTGDTDSWIGTLGHTWTLGTGFILDGNFSIAQRYHVTQGPDFGENIGLDVLGIPGTNGPDIRQSGFPQFAVSGYTELGQVSTWSPVDRAERSYTGTTNATKLRGSHEIRFGVDIVRHELNHWQPEVGAGPRGRFNFTGSETALNGGVGANQFNAFAAFLLGTPINVQKTLQYEVMTTREWQMGFYIRDRWQVNQNLTLTLGLRYELFPIMHRADRGIELLDLNSPVQLGANGLPNGNMKVLIGGRGGNPETLGISSSKKMFAPRIGLAYRMGDDTVIRTGYGITYDPMPFGRPLRGFYPATIASTFEATATGASATFTPFGFNNVGRNVGLGVGIPDFTGPDLTSGVVDLPGFVEMRSPYPGQLHRGYIQSWNVFVDRKLGADFRVEAGYVGTQTVHQLGDININVAQAPDGIRPLQSKYGRTNNTLLWDGFASSNYHALQVAINRRLTRGIFVKGAYTYSKAINYFDDTGWAGLPLFNALSQVRRNRALAGYDIPHNFQIGSAVELPFGRSKKWASEGAAAKVLGGWQLNSIFSSVMGRPLTVTAGTGSLNAPGNSQTPDFLSKATYPNGTGPGQYWFDPNVFRPVEFDPAYIAAPATAKPRRWGTAGRSVLRGPGFVNLDLSLVRTFRMTERIKMDFRVDAFNFTNTPHWNNPGTNASAPTRLADGTIARRPDGTLITNGFGEITTARDDQRQFRFGVRFEF